jgi:hypothetical protein
MGQPGPMNSLWGLLYEYDEPMRIVRLSLSRISFRKAPQIREHARWKMASWDSAPEGLH